MTIHFRHEFRIRATGRCHRQSSSHSTSGLLRSDASVSGVFPVRSKAAVTLFVNIGLPKLNPAADGKGILTWISSCTY